MWQNKSDESEGTVLFDSLHTLDHQEKEITMGKFDVNEVGIDALLPDKEEDSFKRQGINKMCGLVRTALCAEHIHHMQF